MAKLTKIPQNNSPQNLISQKIITLSIHELKLTKSNSMQAILQIRNQENKKLKQIIIENNKLQDLHFRVDSLCLNAVLLVCSRINNKLNKYDKQVGEVQLNSKNNVANIYGRFLDQEVTCAIGYELKLKKINHFTHDSILFQQQYGNIHHRKNKKSLNRSYERHHFYEPDTRIIELSQEQGSQENFQNYQQDQALTKKVIEASKILQDSLKNTQDERKLFTKYLDESTSFLNQLMNQISEKEPQNSSLKQLDISQIKQQKQDQQLVTTQQKWYENKFNKKNIKGRKGMKRPRMLKIFKSDKQQQKKVEITLFNQESVDSNKKKQISQIIINTTEKPKQINLFVLDKKSNKLKKFAKMTKQDNEPSNIWPVKILIDEDHGPIHLSCIVEKQQFVGCIGKQQQKLQCSQLYDKNGNYKGHMYFKCTNVCQSVVQTQDIISLQTEKQKQIDKQQQQTIKKQRSLSQNLGDNLTPCMAKSSSNRKRKITNYSVIFQNQDKASNQLHIETPRSKPVNDANQLAVSDIKRQQQKIDTKSQIPTLLKEPFSPVKTKQTRLCQSSICNLSSKKFQQNLFPQLKPKGQRKYTELNIQENRNRKQMNQKISQNDSPLFQRSRTMPRQEEEVVKNITFLQKYQYEYQKNNQINPTKSSIFKETSQYKQQANNPLSSRLRQSSISLLERRQKNLVNLKILGIKLKIKQPNSNSKFIKFYTHHQSSFYLTQSSSQSQFPNWKLKGYLFINTPKLSNIYVQMFYQTGQGPIPSGTCIVNLGLLQTHFYGINQYEDALLNQDKQIVAEFVLQYQFFQRNTGNLSSIITSSDRKNQYQKTQSIIQKLQQKNNKNSKINSDKKIKSANYSLTGSKLAEIKLQSLGLGTNRTKRASSLQNHNNKQQLSNSELRKKLISQLEKLNKSSLKKRKYIGGNIIIPKAERFKTDPTQISIPGPGEYKQSSQFQRHAIKQ